MGVFLGDGGIPTKISSDGFGECLGLFRLSVNEEDAFGRAVEAEEPSEHFLIIGVSGKAANLFDPGPNRYIHAEEPDLFPAFEDAVSTCADSLVADEEHRVLFEGESFAEVVDDAAAGGHSTGGDDDGSFLDRVDALGVAYADAQVQVARAEDVFAREELFAAAEIEVGDVPAVDVKGFDRHGGIEKDGDAFGNLAGVFQLAEDVEKGLGAPDGEGGDEEHPAPFEGLSDDMGHLANRIRRLVQTIAVGGFHDEVIDVVDLRGRAKKGVARAADVSAEDDLARAAEVGRFQVEGGRSEDVAHGAELAPDAWCCFEMASIGHRLEEWEDRPRVAFIEEGLGRTVLGATLAVAPFGFLFLKASGVRQKNVREVRRGIGADDGTREAALHDCGQEADMVDVCVREEDEVDLPGIDGECLPIFLPESLGPLKEAAVDEDLAASRFQKVPRASDGTGATEEGQTGGVHALKESPELCIHKF